MSDLKAKALGARLARATTAFVTKHGIPFPPDYEHWYLVTVVWDGKTEGEPKVLYPAAAPEGFEMFARAYLAKNP